MPTIHSPRFALREATADWHERVDRVFSSADLASRGGYGRFLLAQAAAHVPQESVLDDAGIAAVLPDWPERRRARLIRDDLAALGLALPTPERAATPKGVPAMLGAAYVLEGSRLGGSVLRRSVPDGFPVAFLSANRPAAWRELISVLDARLVTPADTDAAIAAACGVFALFERSGRQFLKGASVAVER